MKLSPHPPSGQPKLGVPILPSDGRRRHPVTHVPRVGSQPHLRYASARQVANRWAVFWNVFRLRSNYGETSQRSWASVAPCLSSSSSASSQFVSTRRVGVATEASSWFNARPTFDSDQNSSATPPLPSSFSVKTKRELADEPSALHSIALSWAVGGGGGAS